MRIKKTMPIIIALIIILNTLIPTIVLSANDLNPCNSNLFKYIYFHPYLKFCCYLFLFFI